MNNSNFRKTMENTKDNKNINLVKSQKLYQSMMKLHFKDGFPFLKVISCRYAKNRDQDEEAIVPWTSNI